MLRRELAICARSLILQAKRLAKAQWRRGGEAERGRLSHASLDGASHQAKKRSPGTSHPKNGASPRLHQAFTEPKKSTNTMT